MDLVQTLALLKLGADFSAGLVAMIWKFVPITEPQHYSVGAITLLRVCLCVPLTRAILVPSTLSRMQLLVLWGLYHGLFTLLKTVIGVTTSRHAPAMYRKAVARTNFLVLFAGILLGLLAAAGFVAVTFGFGTNLPSADTVIED